MGEEEEYLDFVAQLADNEKQRQRSDEYVAAVLSLEVEFQEALSARERAEPPRTFKVIR